MIKFTSSPGTGTGIRRAAKAGVVAVLAIAGWATMSQPVEAACCVAYQHKHVEQVGQKVEDHFTSRIDSMERALTSLIKLATAQLVSTLKEQVQGQAQIAQTQDTRDVIRRIEDARYRATLAAQTGASACDVITSTLVAQSGNTVINLVTAASADTQTKWDRGIPPGDTEPNPTGSTERARDYLIIANANFCDEEGARLGICKIDKPERYRGATLHASKSILASNTLDNETLKASAIFTTNTINPNPQGAFQQHLVNTEQGKRLYAQRLAKRARTSVAEHTINQTIARRSPDQKVVGGPLGSRAWAEAYAAKVMGYKKDGSNFPNGVSWTDWMELRSKGWAFNPTWLNTINQATDPNLILKEMASILAFMTYQNWTQYQLMEQLNIVQATQLGLMLDGSGT